MSSISLSKSRLAIIAAIIYTLVMAIAMAYMKTVLGITYGEPAMVEVLLPVLIVLNLINGVWIIQSFSWAGVGFRHLNTRGLLWFLPSIVLLIAMWVVCLTDLVATPLNATQWRLIALAGISTFLVGLGEETMYRGIVLHGFLNNGRVRWAMLVSAIAFSLLHAVNIFGGVLLGGMIMQLVLTFLLGFLFAPLMIQLNNLWPLIVFHWLWDFVLFTAAIVGEQLAQTVSLMGLIHVPIEILVGTVLWFRVKA